MIAWLWGAVCGAIGLCVGFIVGWFARGWWDNRPVRRRARLEWDLWLPASVRVLFAVYPEQQVKGEPDMVVQLKPDQQVVYNVAIKDAQGNPAKVQDAKWEITGPLVVSDSNPAVTPTPTPQARTAPAGPATRPGEGGAGTRGYYAVVQATGVDGGGSLTFSSDADLGEGVKPLIATSSIVVTSGQATVVELIPGEPQPIGTGPAHPGPVQTIDSRTARAGRK